MALNLSTINSKRLKERSDYGIRVARHGFDANSCADNQLLFNSNWPILQICKIVKFTDMDKQHTIYVKQTTGEVADNVPGWSTSGAVPIPKPFWYRLYRDYPVSNQYVIKVISETAGLAGGVAWNKCVYKKKVHNLGFPPLVLAGKDLGFDDNTAVLFSVDLSTDIDYPYTEKPSPMIKLNSDYGIESTSIFGSKVKGLSTGMFSKLVQAVKTEQTSASNTSGVSWTPLTKDSSVQDISGCLEPYECYRFDGFNNPFCESKGKEFFDKSGVYYKLDIFAAMDYYSGGVFYPEYCYTNVIQSSPYFTCDKQALVILRSPMVSPEYEEVEIYE